MRISTFAVFGALTLTGVGAAAAQSTMAGMPRASASRHGQGTGVIKAIDAKAGTLTLQHGPIPGVGWPAMTMTFKAAPPTLIKGLRVGQAIAFDVRLRGAAAEITAVTPR